MRFHHRDSGIPNIGELPWGSQFCQFYRTRDDFVELLIPYFRAGLENGELCVLLLPDHPEGALTETLRGEPSFRQHLESGQLELVPESRWLALRQRSGNAVLTLLDRSLFSGFDGVRIASSLPGSPGGGLLTRGEIEAVGRNNVVALSAYPRDDFDASGLMDLVKNYRFALVRNGEEWDIIESYEAQIVRDELKRSEEKLRFLFSNMSAGFAYHRLLLNRDGEPSDYVILEVNEAFLRLTGLRRDVVGKRVREALPGIEKDATDWIGVYGKVALTGEPALFESFSEALGRWFEISAFSPQKGYFAVTINDISQRKEAEAEIRKLNEELRENLDQLYAVNVSLRDSRRAALNLMEDAVAARREAEAASTELRQSEAQFRTVANTIPQLCWAANADGWIYWYNQRWYDYTGRTPQEMEGWGWQSVHDPEVLPGVLERWRASIATGKPFEMVFPLRGADGVFRPFLTRVLPVCDQDGRVLRWFGTNTDIEEQRRYQEELHSSNARLNLLAETTSELLRSGSPQRVVEALCQRVLTFLDCQAFFNFLVDEESGRLRLNACAGVSEDVKARIEWLDLGAAVCGCAARDACRIVAEDIQHSPDPRVELVKSYGLTAYACHPLMVQGRVYGTLSFGTSTRTSFDEKELALMKAVADQVSIAMERQRMEESVRQSEAVLEAFFDASPGILTIQDEELTFIKSDRLTPTYFGLDRHSIVGRKMSDLAPEFMERHGAMMRRVMESATPELNTEVAFGAGSAEKMEHWLASCFPVPLPRGRRGIGVMGVDISGKKLAEEALRRAHDQLEQRVRERTEELAATVDTLRKEIAERKRAEAKLHRLNRLHAVLNEIDQAIVRAAGRDSLFRDFCRIATEQGEFLLAWVGVLDEEGHIEVVASSGATGYLDDISITAHREPAGEGPTGISIREGAYYICNDFQNDPCTRPWHEKGRKHGIQASASISLKEEGRVVGALTLYAGERDAFDEQHEALLRQMGADISFALDNLLREERRRKAEHALQQETLERLRAVEDLREKERLLIQQSRQAAMGEMIGNIAHQWRQPLNTLGLMVQELSMCYELGDFSKGYLENTVKGVMQIVSHMSHTIDDFRNFFRPEKEKVEFRVRQVIQNVISLVDASLKEHRITVEVSSSADPSVLGYPNEYSQVLMNILLNARDALNERGIEDRRIEVRLGEENGRSVVTIADNAGGIAADIIDKIFDPYFTTKGPDKGTGVGLYMSKAIIEKNMNGRLTAHNSGDGAHFRIEV